VTENNNSKRHTTDITLTQPLTPSALHEYGILNDISIPSESFNPAGQWKHSYQIWCAQKPLNRYAGWITISRTPSDKGLGAILDIEKAVLQTSLTIHQTKAIIQCSTDQLSSPLSWQIESLLIDRKGKPLIETRISQKARVAHGVIEVHDGQRFFRRKTPVTITSDFSLFDAVQRFTGRDTTLFRFALLEDLDLIKKNQQLAFCEETGNIEIGGKMISLHSYEQAGDGILPQRYWLDDQHRLILVLSHQRAYIFDPNARQRLQPEIKAHLAEEQRITEWIRKQTQDK